MFLCYNNNGENMNKRVKKRRLKKGPIIVLTVIVIICFILIKNFFLKKDFVIILQNSEANYGEEYTPKFTASYKGNPVTSKVTYDNQIDTTKMGNQKIVFTYTTNGKTIQSIKTIKVTDLKAPELTLKRGEHIRVLKDSEFKEPGYKAIDNYDGELTSKVSVSGKVNTSKEGDYELTYKVKDSHKNETKVTRVVTVTSDSPINLSIEDFTLDGYFDDVILKETEDYGEEYTDEFVFAGDSIALYYVINDAIGGRRLWHQISINPETAQTNPIYINHIDTEKTFVENLKEKKPEKMIFTLGTNGAIMSTDYFIECYRELLIQMQEASPDTLLIVQSIPPVDSSYDENEKGISNKKINELNYYLAEVCSELSIPFLNSAEALKGSDGALKKEYSIDDGIHPSEAGTEVMMNYMRTHAYTGQ